MISKRTVTFGDLLKRYRMAAGLTQEELAEKAGLSPKGISDLERGARTSPRRDTVALVAAALGLSDRDRATLEAAARQRPLPAAELGGTSAERPAGAQASTGGAPPLAGRERELALLRAQLDEGGPPLVAVVGEPGIGKSRLLHEAAAHAAERGWRVLAGGCHRRSGQEPYAPFLGLLERALAPLPPAQLRLALQGCGWLVRLLPELGEAVPPPAALGQLAAEQERRMMFAAVTRFFANVAGPAGMLVTLDDLQWAGQDALDLLGAILRAPAPERPLRLIIAYRDTEVRSRDPLSTLLADLAREGLLARVELAPLPASEAADLLSGLLAQDGGAANPLHRRVLERAGGIPFFLVNWAQGLRSGAIAGASGADVPWSVGETLRQRVAALPSAAQELLGLAAVAGGSTPRALLLHAAADLGHGEEEALAALDATVQARLLAEDGPHAYVFAHDLIREVVTADLSAARRALLHRLVAEALEAQPGEPPFEQLAYQLSRAGLPDRAIPYLERAAERAKALYANAQAAEQYAELVARLDELGRAEDAARARERLGLVLTIMARYDDVLSVLERAGQTYRAMGDLDGQRRVMAQVGWIYAHRGQYQEGLARVLPLTAAGGAGGDAPSQGMASLHATLAYLYYTAGRYDEQRAAAERGIQLARAEGDELALVLAQDRLALALLMLGRLDDGIRMLTDVVIPVAEGNADLTRTLVRATHNVSWAYSLRGEFALEQQYLERAYAAAERIGDPADLTFLLFKRGRNAMRAGDWKQARAYLEQAAARIQPVGSSRFAVDPLHGLGTLALAEGHWEEAERLMDEARAWAERTGDREALRIIETRLAERLLLERRGEEALERLRPLLDGPFEQPGVLEHMPVLAWAHLEAGDAARAAELLEETLAAAGAARMRPTVAAALQVRAVLALREGRPRDAERDIAESLSLARAMPYPYAEARALHVRGRVHATQGEREAALADYAAALAILNRMGERLYAAAVERGAAALDGA